MVQVWWDGRGGRCKRYTFHATDLQDARQQAPEHRAKLIKKVDLPKVRQEERKASRAAHQKRSSTKLADVVETYFEKKPLEERFWKELKRRFDRYIVPQLGATTPLADISADQIEALIDEKLSEGYPVAARTLYEALRPFFNWCASRKRKLLGVSPMGGVEIPELPAHRERILTDDEIKLFWSATAELPLFGPFYRALLLSAQRREEVGAMTWGEINGNEWIIPGSRTKNGKTHIVHLSPQVMSILEEQPRRGEYVFGKTGSAPISGYGKAKAQLDQLMGDIPHWRVHDLRRTARTGLAKLRIPQEVAEKILNHSSKNKLDAVYNQYDYFEERKRAIYNWGNYVSSLVSTG
jgi:integrase